MDFFSLLWIFFIISSLQPIIRQKILEMKRLRMFEQLERSRTSRVIALIHRQETMSLLGFPLLKCWNVNLSEKSMTIRSLWPILLKRPFDKSR